MHSSVLKFCMHVSQTFINMLEFFQIFVKGHDQSLDQCPIIDTRMPMEFWKSSHGSDKWLL